MSILDLKLYGDPILRERAAPIEKISERHRKLAGDMAETMYDAKGIGLAANQIGVLERIIVVDVDWTDKHGKRADRCPIPMINPEILEESIEDDVYAEGCLSLPKLEGDVWRAKKISYRYMDLQGNQIQAEAEGLKARCILHEIDHLNGILFIDRLAPADREKIAGKLALLRKNQTKDQNPAPLAD